MKEIIEKVRALLKPILYIIPCVIIAGAAFFAATNRAAANTTVELDSYDISKLELVLKESQQTEPEDTPKKTTTQKKSASKTSDTKSSKHGDAQSFVDGTYEGEGVGYAGHIKVKVVVKDSKIVSIEVTEVEADDAPFVSKAKGVIDSILEYQTLDVDTISGATFSSKGIIAAVRNALEGVEDTSETAAPPAKPAPTAVPQFEDSKYKDGTYYGTGIGFGGEVKVKVVIADGIITEITIESAGGEDGSYLARAKTLIAKVLEQQSPNVDTVSGATYTSNGIISAIQNALSQARQEGDDSEGTGDEDEKPDYSKEEKEAASTNNSIIAQEVAENVVYNDGTYTGSAKGFRGDTQATVTIKKSKIEKISISSQDDESFLKRAMTLVDVIIKQQTAEGIDVVSGATYSSNGILNSVKEALKKAMKNGGTTENNTSTPTVTPTPRPTSTPRPTPTPRPTSAPGEEPVESPYKDGTYEGSGVGFWGSMTVIVTIENGYITRIDVKTYVDDDEYFWDAYDGVVEQILDNQSADSIDAVSGATYSSNGIINAVIKALEQAQK